MTAACQSPSGNEVLDHVFSEAGLSRALNPFAQLMACLFTTSHRLSDIRCVRCPQLGSGQRLLLDILTKSGMDESELSLGLRRLMSSLDMQQGASAAKQVTAVIHGVDSSRIDRMLGRLVARMALHVSQQTPPHHPAHGHRVTRRCWPPCTDFMTGAIFDET